MTFHRGGIDSFVMTSRRSLGELLYLRIWHDNTGVWNVLMENDIEGSSALQNFVN